MKFFIAIVFGKTIAFILKILNRGGATALPGLIALKLEPHFNRSFSPQFLKGIILISGTNGKTTTASLIAKIIRDQGFCLLHNTNGSNLRRGIASVFIKNANLLGKIKADYGVFEIDEAVLPYVLEEINPRAIILNNLFRDQLDRYGEIDTLAKKWHESLKKLDDSTILILNGDDPMIASLGEDHPLQTYFYGITAENINGSNHHHADSIFCPYCLSPLAYKCCYYSHIGKWKCPKCNKQNPPLALSAKNVMSNNSHQSLTFVNSKSIVVKTNLLGIYNVYNTLAAYLVTQKLDLNEGEITSSIGEFYPAFGRQERLTVGDKEVFVLLSKNPTGFSQSIKAIAPQKVNNLLLVLNDRIADGEDVSWIADIDFHHLNYQKANLTISGTRAYELALRLKYESDKITNDNLSQTIESDLRRAVGNALEKTKPGETLFILPTYTAMLEVRKILTGKQLL